MAQINSDMERIYNLVVTALRANAPVMSGNTRDSIRVDISSGNKLVIVIDPKFYDISTWKSSGVIIPSSDIRSGLLSYAESVNNNGAFGTHNSSQGWIKRVCQECTKNIASEIGAIVVDGMEI